MIDADIQTALKSFLDTELVSLGHSITVQKGFNATTQGAPLEPTIAFHKIGARRYGFQGRRYVYNAGNTNFDGTESWYLEATYQLDALLNPDVLDPARLTAYDVMDLCAGLLQSQAAIDFFLAYLTGIGIRRISDIRTPSSLDDSDRFITGVSFDLVLSYQNTLTPTVGAADVIEGDLFRV